MNIYMIVLYKLFNYVFYLSMLGVIILPIVFFLKRVFKNLGGIRFQYLVWFILVIRLLLPVAPMSKLSIYNYVPSIDKDYYTNSMMVLNDNVNTYTNNEVYKRNAAPDNLITIENTKLQQIIDSIKKLLINIYNVLPFIWILGIFALACIIIILNIRFTLKIKKCPEIADKEIIDEFKKCKAIIGINKKIPLLLMNDTENPVVAGFITPKILIPNSTLKSLNSEELRFIFLHELIHIKRKDTFVNYILIYLSIIYWFNPLIGYAMRKMKEDMEISCDSRVLIEIDEDKAINYGHTILRLAEVSSKTQWLPGTASIVNDKSKIKRRISMIKIFEKKSYKLTAYAIIALIVFGTITLTQAKTISFNPFAASAQKIFDKIDYPFVTDNNVIGKWQVVDFVKNIDEFKPEVTSWRGEPYLKSLAFTENGKMASPIVEGMKFDNEILSDRLSWTKGMILDKKEKTASNYVIQKINGNDYMFYEWKSGDYTNRGMKPYYYVLKKTASAIVIEQAGKQNITDKIDHPFIEDNQIVGTWEAVDFVKTIDEFKPESLSWKGDVYLKKMFMLKEGKVASLETTSETSDGITPVSWLTWTKGYIIDSNLKTASNYIIKSISGESYMFYEWKSGDYTIRGMQPYYYVLKKAN